MVFVLWLTFKLVSLTYWKQLQNRAKIVQCVVINWHYKIFCVNVKYGIQSGFRIFYLIALQNEEDYEREESCSA